MVSGKLVPSVCLLVGHRLDNSRSTIPCEGGWVSGTLVLRVDGLYSVLDWWTFYPAGFLEWLLVFNYSQESNDRSAMHLDLLRRTRATLLDSERVLSLTERFCQPFLRGPPGAYWIPMSLEKIDHIPKTFRFSRSRICWSSSSHRVFLFSNESLFKTEIILKIVQGYDRGLPGVLDHYFP